MILSNFGSAVLKSDMDFDYWCLEHDIAKLKDRMYYASEPKDEHKVYDELVAKGYNVHKSLFCAGGKNQYTYTIPRTQEEKELYWQHEINFRYIYISLWMGSTEDAERWVNETYSNPSRSKVEKYEFMKTHKPNLPYCVAGKQCSLFCPHYSATGCQLSPQEQEKVNQLLDFYKVERKKKIC